MAERLTEYFENGAYTEKQNIIDVSDKVKFFEAGCVMGKAINKLSKLEDILEKYDLKVEELDERIYNGAMNYVDKLKAEADRDTWKRACELACRHIAEVEWLSCPETDDISESENEIKTLTKQSLNYFYQQASKNGGE